MIIVAVAFSRSYPHDQEVTLEKGQSATAGRYTLTFNDLRGKQAPQRFEIKANVGITRDGRSLGALTPQMNYYPVSREPLGSPSVRSTLAEDLYLTLLHFEQDGSKITLHVIETPAVAWIWIGGMVAMGGGFLALALGRKGKAS